MTRLPAALTLCAALVYGLSVLEPVEPPGESPPPDEPESATRTAPSPPAQPPRLDHDALAHAPPAGTLWGRESPPASLADVGRWSPRGPADSIIDDRLFELGDHYAAAVLKEWRRFTRAPVGALDLASPPFASGALSVAVYGDSNQDGAVDARDLVTWQMGSRKSAAFGGDQPGVVEAGAPVDAQPR